VSPKRAKRSEGRVVGESEELMKEGDILILRDCFRGARRPRPPVVYAPMPRPRLLLPRPPGACDTLGTGLYQRAAGQTACHACLWCVDDVEIIF